MVDLAFIKIVATESYLTGLKIGCFVFTSTLEGHFAFDFAPHSNLEASSTRWVIEAELIIRAPTL
jgi:hypothetical protein